MNSAAAPGIDAGRRRRQLPAEVSAFVGRTDELAALAGLLRRGRHVTVTGPGGVGKTRLALRAAADAANRYADGSAWSSSPAWPTRRCCRWRWPSASGCTAAIPAPPAPPSSITCGASGCC